MTVKVILAIDNHEDTATHLKKTRGSHTTRLETAQKANRLRDEIDIPIDVTLNRMTDGNRHRGHRDDGYDDRRQQRRDRSDVRTDRQSDEGFGWMNSGKDRVDKNNVKSEEFWSKESKLKTKTNKDDEKVVDKQKPNFETTGKLLEDTNVVNGVVIKYSEPLEAHKPKRKWRFYPFKGDESLPFIPIHKQSAYLMGRDRKVADIPIDHPSCSKQHAVIQFRLVEYERDDMTTGKRIRPYIIDLESSNGTFVNNQKIEPKRYYELFEKDVIKFGFSTREYVVLHEQSQDEEDDDDVSVEEEEEEVRVKEEPND